MSNYTDFGIRARVIMLQKNITMTDVANHLGVSKSYVSYIFNGRRQGKTKLKEIADFLGMNEGSEISAASNQNA